jgi:outer membrane protein TolC
MALTQLAAAQEPPKLVLSLEEAERQAFEHSPILKGALSDLAAAQSQVEVQLSQLIPRVTVDGSYQYQTQVPNFSPAPGAPAVPFGDHNNYSVGPTLQYTLWDNGGLLKSWRSQKALASSEEAQRDLVRRQVRLITRLDYFQVQLALEQERSLIDSLRLAGAQYNDIDKRYRAGAASRIDWLSAHQQVLDRRRDLRAAQADLAAALRALFAQTGRGQDLDVSSPINARVESPLPAGVSTPTVSIELEPLETVEARLEGAAGAPVDGSYPQLLALSRQAESQKLSADSISAARWPRLQLTYKSDYIYPNLPLLSSVWQNTAGVSASVPLFEWGRTKNQAAAQRMLAASTESRRDEALDELVRDWHKARDQFSALRDEEALDRESIDETAEIARLRYASYRDGGSTILDVETADLNSVQSRVTGARTRTQILIQLATLESLSAWKANNEK